MQVFVTGASRYIGRAVAERLRAGHTVTGLARSDASASRLRAAGGGVVTSVAAGARAADRVISTATPHDPAIDGQAVDAIVEAFVGSGTPSIYTSGVWSHVGRAA